MDAGAGDPPRRNSLRSWRDALNVAPLAAVLVLLILWAAHDGGYDEDTWYWGALILLALLATAALREVTRRARAR